MMTTTTIMLLMRICVVIIAAGITVSCVSAWTMTSSISAFASSSTSLTMMPPQQEQEQIQQQHRRREFMGTVFATTVGTATAVLLPTPTPSTVVHASYIDPVTDPPQITQRVYLDIEIGDGGKNGRGRLVLGLYGDIMPKTVDNFVTLCGANAYRGTTFYRVISDQCIQGGAIGDPTGKSGRSSLEPNGQPFAPDNFNIKHTQLGLVSMVRGLDGNADARFFINTKKEAGWADDRYAAFGIVLSSTATDGGEGASASESGMDLVRTIEKLPVSPPKNAPKTPVTIVKSGIIE